MIPQTEERPGKDAPQTSRSDDDSSVAHDEWPADQPRTTRGDLFEEVATLPAYAQASRRQKRVLEKFIVADAFNPNTRSFERMSRPQMARVLGENERTLAYALAGLRKLGLLTHIRFVRDGGSGAFRDGLTHGQIKVAGQWNLAPFPSCTTAAAQPLQSPPAQPLGTTAAAQPLAHAQALTSYVDTDSKVEEVMSPLTGSTSDEQTSPENPARSVDTSIASLRAPGELYREHHGHYPDQSVPW